MRHYNFTDSLSFGKSWNGDTTAGTVLATLGLTRSMKGSNFNLNYSFRDDPLFAQGAAPIDGVLNGGAQHQVSLNFNRTFSKSLTGTLAAGYGLPLHDSNFLGFLNYVVNRNLTLGFTSTFNQYESYAFTDEEFTVDQKVFGRSLIFTYDTITKKVQFDLASALEAP